METTVFMTIDFVLVPQVLEVFHLFKNIDPVLQVTCTTSGLDLLSMISHLTSAAHMHTNGSHYTCKATVDREDVDINTIGVSTSEIFNAFKDHKGKRVRVQLESLTSPELSVQILEGDQYQLQNCRIQVSKMAKAFAVLPIRECDVACILPTYTLHDLTRQAVSYRERYSNVAVHTEEELAGLIRVDFKEAATGSENPYQILLNDGDIHIDLPAGMVKNHRRSKIGSSLGGSYNASHFFGSTRPICSAVVLRFTRGGEYPLVFEYTLPDDAMLHIALVPVLE
jgi:hypothetical protein